MSSLPVAHSIKENTFRRRVKEARYRTFSGNRAVQELILEIKVIRSELLPTSMSELSRVMIDNRFPELRRPISIESSRDRNLRVKFSGEQGSGPGVTRGWFSAVTKAIHELINVSSSSSSGNSNSTLQEFGVAYRIGGGSTRLWHHPTSMILR